LISGEKEKMFVVVAELRLHVQQRRERVRVSGHDEPLVTISGTSIYI
jgi:hypothetical protein